MRRGELLGLRWRDVDFDASAISIRQIRTVSNDEVVTTTPKTDRGARTIAIDPVTLAVLRAYRTVQRQERLASGPAYAGADTDVVVTNEEGTPPHPDRLSRWFRQRCRDAGLPRYASNDVRHPYVSEPSDEPLGQVQRFHRLSSVIARRVATDDALAASEAVELLHRAHCDDEVRAT